MTLLRNIAHARTGDKGNRSTLTVIAYDLRDYPCLQAQLVANEVEALYTNGPAAGGGATKSVREVIAAAAVLVPRDWAQPSLTVLG